MMLKCNTHCALTKKEKLCELLIYDNKNATIKHNQRESIMNWYLLMNLLNLLKMRAVLECISQVYFFLV